MPRHGDEEATQAGYLERYHVELPQLFVEAILAADFDPPSLTLHELRNLVLPDMG